MNQSNQNIKKSKPKNQSKIHRRKNEQIPKQFMCPVQSCGKAYGSYAALYTHMKNKHNQIKPPNMPNTSKTKVSHPGRPKIKKNGDEKIEQFQDADEEQIICKICQQEQCQCVQSFDSQERKRTIQVMSSQDFTNFTNYIGLLGSDDVNWVRRTQEEFVYKSSQKIKEQINKFNQTHNLHSTPSPKLIEYLSFSSKYWDPQNIDQLYSSVYAIIGIQNHQACIKFIMQGNFQKMQICIKKNPNQFKKLDHVIRSI